MSNEVTAVYTKWGWINQKALYRLKTAYDDAEARKLDFFNIDGHPFLTNFAKYLIAYCEMERLVPVRTDEAVPIFEPSQGNA